MAEGLGTFRHPRRLVFRLPELIVIMGVGAIACWLIADLIPGNSRWLTYLFIAFSVYGVVFAAKAVRRALRFLKIPNGDEVGHVFVIASARRESLKAVGALVFASLGILGVDPPSWFGTYFIASLFYLVYINNVNSTLDDTLPVRLRAAREIDDRRAATEVTKKARASKVKASRKSPKK